MILSSLLAAEAAEKAQPLIDIDGTVFIQFGIFLVTMAVLWTLVFKPYLAVQEERGRRIDGARRDATTMQERAQGMMNDYEARLLEAKRHGADERRKLRGEGEAYEREVLARAREVGQKALGEAMATANAQRDAARTRLLADAQTIGRQIASRVLGRQVS
jgi:F-type H+-transporting ATPase subunit b